MHTLSFLLAPGMLCLANKLSLTPYGASIDLLVPPWVLRGTYNYHFKLFQIIYSSTIAELLLITFYLITSTHNDNGQQRQDDRKYQKNSFKKCS